MGIQINGSTDIISAVDGSLTVENLSINTSGVGTFGSLDISGNVSVGGTLTYEDVANVESVGVATFRDDVNIGAGATTAILQVSTGRIGIGTDNPNRLLTLKSTNPIIGLTDYDAGGEFYIQNSSGSGILNADFFRILTNDSSEVVRISSAGLVGIGTDSPDTRLTVNSGTTDVVANFASADANAWIQLRDTTTTDTAVMVGANGDNLLLRAGSNERLRITSTGDVVLAAGQTVGSSAGVVTYFGDGSQLSGISVGLTTEATTPSNAVTELDLTAAQDHKVTATGICTITVTGGTEADSHTIRIVNSGISTVGFSTYFLFPSGAAPTLPTADGAISLISFTVHRVGAAGTQLLAGASVNFS